MRHEADRNDAGGFLRGGDLAGIAHWAVHAGGRTVLDAAEAGLRLPSDPLQHSRAVLHAVGNVSSATLMFVLARVLNRHAGGGDVLWEKGRERG